MPSQDHVTFARDGALCMRNALSARTVALAEAAFDWSFAHPGPNVSAEGPAESPTFCQDRANPEAFEAYARLLEQPDLCALVTDVLATNDVWFMYEQVFSKAGAARRTPWHQDTSYLPVDGPELAVLWISFDSIPPEQALEFVGASHQGTLFDGSTFNPKDDTAPLYGDGSMPRLPNIQSERQTDPDRWPILSWATEPGDVIVFHPSTLHGGAPTGSGDLRRTLTLRFFGNRAFVARRPDGRIFPEPPPGTLVHPLTQVRAAQAGAPFAHPDFPRMSSGRG